MTTHTHCDKCKREIEEDPSLGHIILNSDWCKEEFGEEPDFQQYKESIDLCNTCAEAIYDIIETDQLIGKTMCDCRHKIRKLKPCHDCLIESRVAAGNAYIVCEWLKRAGLCLRD